MAKRDLDIAKGLTNSIVSHAADMFDSVGGDAPDGYQASFVEHMVRTFKEEGKDYEQMADWVIDYYGSPETCADIFAYIDSIWNDL